MELKLKLEKAFPNSIIKVLGDNDHYKVYVESELFNGLSLIEQHRLIYKAINGNESYHALSIETKGLEK